MLKLLARAGWALALACLALPAHAQTPTADADPALWVVEDADTTIYLFGTIHVLKPGLGWFDEAVKDAFDKSDSVMLEIVEPDPATLQALVLPMVSNPTGPSVTERLPEDKRATYAAALTDLGIPPSALDRLDPWYAALALTNLSLPKYGYDPQQGADKAVAAAAKAAAKPISGLETVEQQLGYFDTMPVELQVRFLVQTLGELPELKTTLDKMVASWSAGEPDTLAALLNEDAAELPEVWKILLHDRNQRWADWIARRMAEPGTVFVAVGAGHLAGEDSVQAFLAAHHLKAERVRY